eukprot:263167-Hanusia_phi.AAC.6
MSQPRKAPTQWHFNESSYRRPRGRPTPGDSAPECEGGGVGEEGGTALMGGEPKLIKEERGEGEGSDTSGTSPVGGMVGVTFRQRLGLSIRGTLDRSPVSCLLGNHRTRNALVKSSQAVVEMESASLTDVHQDDCPWITSQTYKCQILCVLPFLGNIDSDFRDDLLSALSMRVAIAPFHRSEVLAQDEHQRDCLFIVMHGEVISHIEKKTYKFGPGDYFGDWNFFHVRPHKHSKYLALTDGVCLSLSKSSFDEVLSAFPQEVSDHVSICSEYFHGFDLFEEFEAERASQIHWLSMFRKVLVKSHSRLPESCDSWRPKAIASVTSTISTMTADSLRLHSQFMEASGRSDVDESSLNMMSTELELKSSLLIMHRRLLAMLLLHTLGGQLNMMHRKLTWVQSVSSMLSQMN